jgi:hypothetical protein
MDESQWLTGSVPSRMMRHLRESPGAGVELRSWFAHPSYGTLPRKWRLFLAACCRRVWPLLGSGNGPAQRLIEFAEGFADAPPTEESRQRVLAWFGNGKISTQYGRLIWGLTAPLAAAAGELRNIAGQHARQTEKADKWKGERAALDAERLAQCALIRDLFGNPFRPVAFDPVWRSDTVVCLARAMYESRDFGSLPILADALEDTGCTDTAVLSHLRGPGPHIQGCWVLELCSGNV